MVLKYCCNNYHKERDKIQNPRDTSLLRSSLLILTRSSLTCCTPFWLVRMPTFSVNTSQSPCRVTFLPLGFISLLNFRSSAKEDAETATTDRFGPTLICTFLDEVDFFEVIVVEDWDEDFIEVDIEVVWETDFLEVWEEEEDEIEIGFSTIGGSLALVVWAAKTIFSTSLVGGSDTSRTWSTCTWMSHWRPGLVLAGAVWTGLRLEEVST